MSVARFWPNLDLIDVRFVLTKYCVYNEVWEGGNLVKSSCKGNFHYLLTRSR